MSVSIEIDVKDVINDIEKYSLEVQKNIKLEIATTGREVETTYKQNTPLVTARLKSSIIQKILALEHLFIMNG
jgi:hypothetical protein